MKLEVGKCDYPLPNCCTDPLSAQITETRGDMSWSFVLHRVEPRAWERMRGDPGKPALRGRPLYFAWFPLENVVRLYPEPDNDGVLLFRYYVIHEA